MKIEFYKYQGTGNDFIILDNRTGMYDSINNKQVAKLCDRKFGIGADGLMLMNSKEGYDFEMKYFNADGNQSSMCGNGGRCMVQCAYHMGIHKYTYRFLAADGLHEAEIDNKQEIKLKMLDVTAVETAHHHSILNTGSPHFVTFVTDILNVDVVESGRNVRESKEFKQEGINVNFVETFKSDEIFVRTYERGVEDETLSCGTGVTAAALISAHNDVGFNRVEVKTLGGKLSVEFTKLSPTHFEDIWLCGPAVLVFKGEMELGIGS
jgi:diaminopimelate epimerase